MKKPKLPFLFFILCYCIFPLINALHSRPENLKKVQAKKLVKSNKSFFFREIAFLAVFNFFPVQKFIFWPSFLKLQKMDFGEKNF